jgi:predicted alpha/beta hydrolase family esterase
MPQTDVLSTIAQVTGVGPKHWQPWWKARLMRHLSQHYAKSQMKWVYSSVKAIYG